jgi:hypothetical protein
MELKQRLRQIYELAKNSGNVELQEKLIELREDFLTLQIEMQFDGSVYWRFQAGYRDGPFCPECLNGKNLLALLERRDSDFKLVCKLCNGEFLNAPRPWAP